MDLMYSKDPNVFNNPEITRIGNCQFRRFRTEVIRKNEAQLGPYTENDGKFLTISVENKMYLM